MKGVMIKELEKDYSLGKINEGVVRDYKQTKDTRDAIKEYIIEPFESTIKKRGEESVFEGDGLSVNVEQSYTPIVNSDEEVLKLFETQLKIARKNNTNAKRMDGVKRYKDLQCVDASYMNHLFYDWRITPVGKKEDLIIHRSGYREQEVAKEHAGRVLMQNSVIPIDKIDYDTVALYFAGKSQVQALEDIMIRPFESIFMNDSLKNSSVESKVSKNYGSFCVEVNTTPKERLKDDAVDNLHSKVMEYARLREFQTNQVDIFFNRGLVLPRAYVSIDRLISDINQTKEQKTFDYEQTMNVYEPNRVVVWAK